MKLVNKYLLKAFVGPLIVCLIVFNSIFIIFDMFGNLSKFIDAETSIFFIIRYYIGIFALYSSWFFPASCMLATLYTMWQLSHHSELTAMRASGISFHKLTIPFFAVALFMSICTIFNSEYVIPRVSRWSDSFDKTDFRAPDVDYRHNLPYVGSQGSNTWYFVNVNVSSEQSLRNPGALDVRGSYIDENKDKKYWGVRTDNAKYLDGVWWFHYPQQLEFDFDGSELLIPNVTVNVPEWVPQYQLKDTPREMFVSMNNWEFMSAYDKYVYMNATNPDDSEKQFDIWYCTAAPWACVVITLFAIPTGITSGRQSVLKGVLFAVGSFFAFNVLVLVLKFIGQRGYIPPVLAAWLPNIVFLLIGIRLYRKLT